ncbi:phage neck terminator protein [Pseudomonas nitroreducens]|uniref:phage neck terminator protein n=1 Tax=Pseudomonas nitroreducens TaxID=46680 RepID=UPI0004B02A63
MANTSASGGYLTPAGAPTPADEALEDILQPMVVGITGLPGKMVRPRWQPGNPKQPEPNVNWCAIGVMHTKQDANPAIEHDAPGTAPTSTSAIRT